MISQTASATTEKARQTAGAATAQRVSSTSSQRRIAAERSGHLVRAVGSLRVGALLIGGRKLDADRLLDRAVAVRRLLVPVVAAAVVKVGVIAIWIYELAVALSEAS